MKIIKKELQFEENCKRSMKKQVGKSQVFTKASLTKIQDKMRVACIKS